MTSRMRTLAAAVLVAGAGIAGQASAASINFYGAEFDLSLGAGSGATWDVVVTADLTNFDSTHDGKDSAFLTHINWKFSGFSVTSVNSVDPLGDSDVFDNNLTSNGCTGGASGWVCLALDPQLATNDSYSWTFNVTFDGDLGADDLDAIGNPLRARFADSNGDFDDLMSCTAGVEGNRCTTGDAEVPVPGTLGLLGLGLAGLGMVRRRIAA